MFGKKLYSEKEVEKMLSRVKTEYEQKLSDLKIQNSELLSDNNKLTDKLDEFKLKDGNISLALKDAEEKAGEIKEKAHVEYLLLIERLKKFVINWNSYFNSLKERYPTDSNVSEAVKLKEKLGDILYSGNIENKIERLNEELEDAINDGEFNPKEKIDKYVASNSDNGFNIDEVLNPGELRLEDICKELGLTEE